MDAALEDRSGLRESYERGGYRLDDTETLMVCDLAVLVPLTPAPGVTLLPLPGPARAAGAL